MSMFRVLRALAASLLFSSISVQAATLLDESQLIATSVAYEQAAPVARTLTIATAGKYTLTLTDLKTPSAFSSVGVIVTQNSTAVAKIDAAALADSAVVDFDAQPGTYQVRVLGVPAAQSAGTFSITVTAKDGSSALLQVVDGMAAIADIPPTQSTLNTTFAVTDPGTYQISFSDRAFPAALSTYSLAVLAPGGGAPVATLSTSQTSAQFNAAAPGTYALVVISQADVTAGGGLFSVKISGGPAAATVYSQTTTVGKVSPATSISIPSAGTYTLSLTDLLFPAALIDVRAAIVQNAEGATLSASGSAPFIASQGSASLYVAGVASTPPGAGSFGVQLNQGATAIYSSVRSVQLEDPSNANAGFVYHVDLPSSDTYRLTLTDFGFPQAFTTIQAAVTQAGSAIGKLDAPGGLNVSGAAGSIDIVVAAVRASATTSGLFGVSLAHGATTLFETTQGAGELFRASKVSVITAGKYDIQVTDHKFPAAFANLAMAVTRGSTLVGQIFGSGKFSFDATPGDYSLNLIATAGTTTHYAMYGTLVTDATPAPTVTLTASPATISAQQKSTLTWSTTNATSCTASGSWSGSKATSGTFDTGPLSANSSFKLDCSGPGGTTSATATVTLAAQATARHGGGAASPWMLLVLGVFALARRRVSDTQAG